jgi:DNA-binding GntR family transcriptional regulator
MKVNGRSPAESDIQRYFGVSPPTIHQMVLKLESLGLITRKPGVARSIEVLASTGDIPELK